MTNVKSFEDMNENTKFTTALCPKPPLKPFERAGVKESNQQIGAHFH